MKETVIIVHGTWAEPKDDKIQWYQPAAGKKPGGEFVAKLNRALEERNSEARCWNHCDPNNPQIFSWKGGNSWLDRVEASSQLEKLIYELRTTGWRCHVIGHSHGGNIVVEACTPRATEYMPGVPLGKVVTIGTPFICTANAISERKKKANKSADILLFSCIVTLWVFTVIVSTLLYIQDSRNFTENQNNIEYLLLHSELTACFIATVLFRRNILKKYSKNTLFLKSRLCQRQNLPKHRISVKKTKYI